MISSCSSRRANRSASGGDGGPHAGGFPPEQPAPAPHSRPPPPPPVTPRPPARASRPGRAKRAGATRAPQPARGGSPARPGGGVPGVGRPGRARAADGQVVVGSEERVEAEPLGGLGDRQERAVVGALLWFGEYPQLHAPILATAPRFRPRLAGPRRIQLAARLRPRRT